MVSSTSMPQADVSSDQTAQIRQSWPAFLILGLLMVVLGTLAIGWSCLVTITITATWLFGALLLAAGVIEIFHAFSAGRWTGTLLHIVIGVLYVVVGMVILDRPGESAIVLTRIIAIFMIVAGLFRVVLPMAQRFPGWGYVALNGVVTFLLGMLIYAQWPSSGLWFIGLYLGIELIMNGWAWVALGFGLRSLPPASA